MRDFAQRGDDRDINMQSKEYTIYGTKDGISLRNITISGLVRYVDFRYRFSRVGPSRIKIQSQTLQTRDFLNTILPSALNVILMTMLMITFILELSLQI